ncbi:MAG: hypothetical protein MUE69_07675 [Myxococcota bacterium]|jgi:hypothetical protein|nr:hypothetical protein [Myxococcota bacterium]
MTSPRPLRSTALRSTTLRSTTRLAALVLALLTPAWVSAQSPAEGANAALPGAPEGTEALAMRLRARHVRDLPRAETLREPADLARLRWLAEHHHWLVVRTRALLLLAHDPSSDTRALVLRVLDSSAPAIVRAAAVRATQSWALDAALRSRLERLAREDDPRLGDPARRRLSAPASATN